MPLNNLPTIRHRNLLRLHQEFLAASIAQGITSSLDRAFAASLEISPSKWSQLKGGQTLGNRLAQQIESKAGKPAGWLDQEDQDQQDKLRAEFLDACRAAWERTDADGRIRLMEFIRVHH